MTILQYGAYDYISKIYELYIFDVALQGAAFFFTLNNQIFEIQGKLGMQNGGKILEIYFYFMKKYKPKESIYLQEYLDSLLVAHKMSLYLHKIRILRTSHYYTLMSYLRSEYTCQATQSTTL